MSENWESFTDEERAAFFAPGGSFSDPTANGQREEPLFSDDDEAQVYVNYSALIGAPDLSVLVKGTRGKVAKDYTTKVQSVLKAGAIGALKRGNLPDSAAIFRHGPSFAESVGNLAEVSENTRRMVDLATAPENPYVALLFAGLPLISQIFRNHQPEIQMVQQSRRAMKKYRKEHPEEFVNTKPDKRKNVKVNLPFGRSISFRVGLKFNPFKGIRFAIRTQTREPAELVMMVFSDEKLVAALKKQGIRIAQVPL